MHSWSSVSQDDTVVFEFDTEMISSTVMFLQGPLTLASHLFVMSHFPQIGRSLYFVLLFDIEAILVMCSLISHFTGQKHYMHKQCEVNTQCV
jgi:hypothetical protein